ncbi:arginase [Pedobacter polaris]|uniref:Arginase n=1 Tax=Pedobacter polaris TaxID=2571273 RepID=A0A4U1CTT1_9SPHI|nr:formimidoylglutamase [Pedobacter polaris]TKC12617.1 arginase [Pedobacter polaris]
MDSFKIYSQSDIDSLINTRNGEEKLGQHIQIYSHCEEDSTQTISLACLQQSTAQYVLLGIPEDIGVRANLGNAGAKTAWKSALKAFLNTQSNSFLKGDEVLVLGHFEIEEPADISIQGLRNKTNEIDALVYPVIQKIAQVGKIPIVIGGGHNNAAPIISGVSIALNKPLNVVNIDAHADLRDTKEGRHSGNGFSYAMQHGHLNQYRVFGLQENYVHQSLPAYIAASKNIAVIYFEDLLTSKKAIEETWEDFVKDLPEPSGLEIDLDSIENVLSSAITSSGFALNDIRKILLSNHKKYSYLHICEGATELADGRKDLTTGKTIAYLVSDFIKALRPHISQKL